MAGAHSGEVFRKQLPVLAAIVLAAGRSLRFGGVKQIANLDGNSLLGTVLGTVRRLVIRDIILVVGFEAAEVMDSVDLSGIDVVHNPDFDEGLSTSIKSGLRVLRPDVSAVLMVLGDQPFVSPHTIDQLADEYIATGAPAIIPTRGGRRGNPVLLDLSLRPEVELLKGDVGCREMLRGLPRVREVEVDDPGILVDIDTRDDLESLLRRRAEVVRG